MTVDPEPSIFSKALTGARRPRVALMGEFSAGKSTLANLMIGADALPVQVIATQLPPIWVSYGTAPAVIVDLEGNETACDLSTLQDLSAEQIAFIRIECEADILKMCDVIDMPGISDPNMSSEVWERILPLADAVIWCSPATQAWRQSEASAWSLVPEHIRARSILLLTRGDMLVSERDRRKVLKRVRTEAADLFQETLMISLTEARDAEDDPQLWEDSGAEPFVETFLGVVATLAGEVAEDDDRQVALAPNPEVAAPTPQKSVEENTAAPGPAPDGRIVPRRPVAKSVRTRPRPQPVSDDHAEQAPRFS